MQTAMLRLDRLLRRRKRLVLVAWAVLVLAAVPFAARQSENLSSGGFDVPGSQSAAVDRALAGFPGVQRAELAAVLVPEPGATRAQLRAAVDRVGTAAGPIEASPCSRPHGPGAAAAARAGPSWCRSARRSTRTARPTSPPTCASGWTSATARTTA
jgi:RND superfamily putative drug exporter